MGKKRRKKQLPVAPAASADMLNVDDDTLALIFVCVAQSGDAVGSRTLLCTIPLVRTQDFTSDCVSCFCCELKLELFTCGRRATGAAPCLSLLSRKLEEIKIC